MNHHFILSYGNILHAQNYSLIIVVHFSVHVNNNEHMCYLFISIYLFAQFLALHRET